MGRKTQSDRTGQLRNRTRAEKKLLNRLRNIEREVKARFAAIPYRQETQKVFTNADTQTIYIYEMLPQEVGRLRQTIRNITQLELLETTTDILPETWFFLEFIELPYREGAAESVVTMNQLTRQAARNGLIAGTLGRVLQGTGLEVDVSQYLRSAEYTALLRAQQQRNFDLLGRHVSRIETEVNLRLFDGIKAGVSPTDVRASLSHSFDTARSNLIRFADAEVNWAYNSAKLDAVHEISTEFGYEAGVLHTSALLPGRTRQTHAARHGNIYSVQAQEQWWNEGANLVNCKCSTVNVLLDSEGGLVDTEAFPQKKTRESFKDEVDTYRQGEQPPPPFT